MRRDDTAFGYFEAELTLLPPDEGGRQTAIRTGYRPDWWLPGDGTRQYASATIEILGGTDLTPGATGRVRIYPFSPELWEHVDARSNLEMCEGPYVLGKAVVTRVVPAVAPAGTA